MKNSLRQSFQNGILQHLLFWLLSFYFLGLFFAKEYENGFTKINLLYTFLFHVSICLLVYLNLRVGIPLLLRAKKYPLFLIFTVFILVLATYFNLFTFNVLADFLFPDFYFIAYYDWRDIAIFMCIYWLISTLLKLSKSWFLMAEKERAIYELEQEKSRYELSALKAQIHPHFLFNSLNNLYGLALEQDHRTAGFLLQMSKTMRYVLYDAAADMVDLDQEIAFLKEYIALQELRIRSTDRIRFAIKGQTIGQRIVPLVLLPFVENAFKHGIKGDVSAVFIEINLTIEGNILTFSVLNNASRASPSSEIPYSGVGLKNIKRRLDLRYPNKHNLVIVPSKDTFQITLNLEL